MQNINFFKDLVYKDYLVKHPIHELVGVNLEEYGDIDSKQVKPTFFSVDPTNQASYPPELDDFVTTQQYSPTNPLLNVPIHLSFLYTSNVPTSRSKANPILNDSSSVDSCTDRSSHPSHWNDWFLLCLSAQANAALDP